MCVLSIKVPIRKKSGNLFNDPRIMINKYIYIRLYIYLIAWKLIYDHSFHTVFIRQSSGMKPKLAKMAKICQRSL